MKILAIRGRNLASLADDFAVELGAPPLDTVGLLAITGPTGAGKSTLLDAMCLALFDATPRLGNGRSVPIGRPDETETDRLGSQDVRGVLRRGSGAGFAEVDFIGQDGRRYRARWSVRRARERPEGRLQPQEVTLTDLENGAALGRTKSETLAAIEVRLGLSYPQFLRSSLLAQGDFAAFLKADARQRAELLERMTGTEIYGRLSEAAFVRARAEQGRLAELERALGAIPCLEPAARQALEAELGRRMAEAEAARARLVACQRARDWYEALARLRRETAEAEGEVRSAERAWDELGPLGAELEEIERAQPLGPLHLALIERHAEAERARTASERARADVAAARAREQAARGAAETAEARRLAAEAALAQARPALDAAARLDAECESALALAEDAAGRAAEAGQAAAEARRRAERLGRELGRVEKQRAAAEDWLRRHADVAVLATGWERWRQDLERIAAAAGVVARLAEERARLGAERDRAAQADARAAATLAERERAHAAAQAQWEAAERAAARTPMDLEWPERERLDERRRVLEALRLLGEQARAAAQEEAGERAARVEAESRAAEARARAATAGRRKGEVETDLVEAERQLAHARLTEQLARHRDALRPGEPCPLCGATEHLWGGDLSAPPHAAAPGEPPPTARSSRGLGGDERAASVGRVEEVSARQGSDERRAEVEALRRTVRALVEEEAAAAAEAGACARRIDEAGERLARARATLAGYERRWREGCAALLEPAAEPSELSLISGPLDASAESALARAVGGVEERLAAARAGILERERRLAAAHEARAVLEHERLLLEHARRDIETCGRAARAAERAAAEHEREFERAEDERRRALREISPAFADRPLWLAWLGRDPLAFAADVGAEVMAWQQHQAVRGQAEERLTSLLASARAEETRASERAAEAERRAAEERAAAEALSRLRHVRSQLLDGRPTNEVRQALEEALGAATAERDRAAAARAVASEAMAAATSHEQAASRAAEEARAAAEQARERLEQALARHGLDLGRLEALLAHDAAWVAARRDVIAAGRRRVQESRAVLEERRRRLALHLAEDDFVQVVPALRRSLASRGPDAGETHGERGPERLGTAPDESGPGAHGGAMGRGPVLGGTLGESGDLDRIDELAAALAEAEQAVTVAEGERARQWARLQADDEARARATTLRPLLETQRAGTERWQALSELIGSADGKKFRVFAQSLTLESLLHHANQHLGELARRYRLMRVPGHDLDLQVVDQEMGDEVRSTSSLSGGESFLVSLALALGLSSLAARDVRVDTLFIDEGFGTLDPAALESALAVLDSLQSTGRQIGLISHIPGLAERVGVQIRVVPEGGGKSRVVVVSG